MNAVLEAGRVETEPAVGRGGVHKAGRPPTTLTGVVKTFGTDEIIVSKTDTKGLITYANRVFVRVSGYTERELIGAPHCCLRHPRMPRGVFKLLWEQIASGREIFAYVLNRSKYGDEYWVFAHVTPSFDGAGGAGGICGYHSNRRVPDPRKLAKVVPVYEQMMQIERGKANPKDQAAASLAWLSGVLEGKGVSYDEFVFSL